MQTVAVRVPMVIALLFALAIPRTSRAQDVGVGGVVFAADHWLLGEPLSGGRVSVRWPRRDGNVTFRIAGEWLQGDARRIGVVCAGLITPGTCTNNELIRDDSRWGSAAAGTTIRVVGGRRAELAATMDAMLGSVRADTRGLETGKMLSAGKPMWGGLLGLEATWVPVARVPMALELGAGIGMLMPIVDEQSVDGYTPFDHGFGVNHFRVGIAWRGKHEVSP